MAYLFNWVVVTLSV